MPTKQEVIDDITSKLGLSLDDLASRYGVELLSGDLNRSALGNILNTTLKRLSDLTGTPVNTLASQFGINLKGLASIATGTLETAVGGVFSSLASSLGLSASAIAGQYGVNLGSLSSIFKDMMGFGMEKAFQAMGLSQLLSLQTSITSALGAINGIKDAILSLFGLFGSSVQSFKEKFLSGSPTPITDAQARIGQIKDLVVAIRGRF